MVEKTEEIKNNGNKPKTYEGKPTGKWLCCTACGKKLLKRKANGVMVFKFGRNSQGEDVVHIQIFGSIRMQCIRDSCRYMNEFTFFP